MIITCEPLRWETKLFVGVVGKKHDYKQKKTENFGSIHTYPLFVDGGNITLEIFDDSKSLLSRLEKIPRHSDRLIGSDDDVIMTISKNKKNWWVHGYTNGLELLNLEKFEDLKGIKDE